MDVRRNRTILTNRVAFQFLCGLDVDRVLLAKSAGLITGYKTKELNVFGKVSKREDVLFFVIQIVEAETGKV